MSKLQELVDKMYVVLEEYDEEPDSNGETVIELSPIVDALNGVKASIDQLTLQIKEIKHIMALDATKLADLFTLLTQLLATLPTDAATIAGLQQQIATLTANDAALDALAPQLDTLIAGVTAAEPPPAGGGTTGGGGTTTTPPAAFDPTVNYQPGQEVTMPDGTVWTAVTPVLGEAPGVTSGNWTENTSKKKPTGATLKK